jgi:putative CocE/NonD family hydrolase
VRGVKPFSVSWRLVAFGWLATSSPVFAASPAAEATAVAIDAASPKPPAGYHGSRFLIPMRDGVRLDTFVLAPDDDARSYPILLARTPYDPGKRWAQPQEDFARAGYIFVTQSARGRYGSEGQFVHMTPHQDVKRSSADVDASSDAFDTIEWLVRHVPHNNGRVGMLGSSYTGFYAAAAMIDAHPALKAVTPQAPQADWFMGDDLHHNGAFMLAATFSFMASCDRRSTHSKVCGEPGFEAGTDEGYRFYLDMGPLKNADARYFHGDVPEWLTVMKHGTYDSLWQKRNLLPHLRNIKPASLVVSGWYDANNLYGALHVFDAVRHSSPDTPSTLVLGPWTHSQWVLNSGEAVGPFRFGAATTTYFVQKIELPFFEAYLKGDGQANLPVAHVFDTGRNEWQSFDAWPPKQSEKKSLYLQPRRGLGFAPPGAEDAVYDEYVSDPANPVPYVPRGGLDMETAYMARDQGFVASRPDVLTYQSDALAEDITVVGPITPHLVVSTSGTDSDWVVKLIDAYPESGNGELNGFQRLVRGDVMRGKFRSSFVKPAPMKPDTPTTIDFAMPDAFHTFRKGHRIVVQVQSSWFPLVDRNPQQFVDIYSAKASDFRKATQRVFHAPNLASRIELNVLGAASVSDAPR